MRRIIHNTTAIAACLSLMVPSFAQAQTAPDPAEEQVPAAPAEQSEAAAGETATGDAAPEEAAPAEAVAEPDAEAPDAAPVEPGAGEEAPVEPDAEAAPPAGADAEATPEEGSETPAAVPETAPEAGAPAKAAAETAPIKADRPMEAARERTEDRPAERPETDTPEQKSERATKRTERQAAEEEATREAQAERPEPAAREQEAERPPEAAREQTQEGPSETPADDAEAPADADAAAVEGNLRDALAREPQTTEPTPDDRPAPTEAARQAAEETGGSAAAALNDNEKGEVTEQEITKDNSRSSSEDFATSLRDAAAPAEEPVKRAAEKDEDDNDLAKALLLGLGAVAVGSYLNNNRQVALSAPDRVVVTRADGSQEIIKDEVALLRQPGSTVATENFDDGSSRTVVTRTDGSRVVTIRDADLRVLRRTIVSPDGTQTRLIDDTAAVDPVDIATLPAPAPVQTPVAYQDEAALRDALRQQAAVDRRFTLGQIRNIPEVRALVPQINIDAITFDTGSAAITPDQARQLAALGRVIQKSVADNPQEVFLIEGHTDTVGSDAANLALSDRRAESVALALSEYFAVPPENLVVQGYGEQFPEVLRAGDVRENRRAAVRRITGLLQTAKAE